MADKEGQGQGKRSLEARADAFSRLKKQIRSFIFWENLRRANLLTVLSDL